MLYIDSIGQIIIGLSKRCWIILFKKVSLSNKNARNFRALKLFKNLNPDHILGSVGS